MAALLGDLPALDGESLRAALEAAGRRAESFVPDADGTGTVLRCGRGFTPRFGADSASRHEADGAVRLELPLPRLRTDVDDARSLAAGAPPRARPGDTQPSSQHRASGWIRSMQATVHRFDPETHTGSVLRDDGVELASRHRPSRRAACACCASASGSRSRSSTTSSSRCTSSGVGPGQPIR